MEEARKIAGIGLARAAARSAYYAAFHAAEAFIIERTGRIAKSHSGVRTTFANLARTTPELDRSFTTFLAQAYKFKEIGDYGVGHGAAVTVAQAEESINMAERFVHAINTVLS